MRSIILALVASMGLSALPLSNPGFECGEYAWKSTTPGAFGGSDTHGGLWKVAMGGKGVQGSESLEQTFTLSPKASEIGFWCKVDSKETSFFRMYDKLTVTLSDGQTSQSLAVVSNLDKGKGYRYYSAKIDPSFAGKDVTLSFVCTEGQGYPTSFFIDDIQIDENAVEAPQAPVITAFEPVSGPIGTQVVIRGAHLTGVSSVAFNGTPTQFRIISNAEVAVAVPEGATTGVITVVTPGGTVSTATPFTVTAVVIPTDPTTDKDITVGGAYIVQSTQDVKGSVPLVNGRSGFLRVFVTANASGMVPPPVKVEMFDAASQGSIKTWMINSTATELPTSVDDNKLENSYNVKIDGADMLVGRYLQITVDPDNTVTEANETNNVVRYPESGALDLRIVKPLRVTLVPTITEGNEPNLNSGNMDAYMDFAYRVWPVPSYNANVREALTSSAKLRPSPNEVNGWDQLLNEITALWRAESGDNRHFFYGVVRPPYSGYGITGMGWSGIFPCSTGWDSIGNGLASQTLAHEIGHNFRILHVPCEGEANVDKKWPYPDAFVGTNGMDIVDDTFKSKTDFVDLMSYCRPKWVSDYIYKKALNHLQEVVPAAETQMTRCMMVWGRMNGANVTLEPVFAINGVPTQNDEHGSCSVKFYGATGNLISETSFDAIPMAAHENGSSGTEGFAVNVPVTNGQQQEIAEVKLFRDGKEIAKRFMTGKMLYNTRQALSVNRLNYGKVKLTWDANVHPMIMVKYKGKVIAFARGGEFVVHTSHDDLEFVYSD